MANEPWYTKVLAWILMKTIGSDNPRESTGGGGGGIEKAE